MKYTIYHNSRCSKSRCALEWLQKSKKEIEVIDYMNQPLTVEVLRQIAAQLGLGPELWIRKDEADYKTHVLGKNLSENELFELMLAFPKLIQRPIVLWADRGVVARPLELLIEAINDAD